MRVVSHDYPYLEVHWHVDEHSSSASAYVDTGFDGGLIVPMSELANLPDPVDITIIQLGDGTMTWVPEYLGTVVLGDRAFSVSIACVSDEYLLGREIIDLVTICFRQGRAVEVEV